MFWKKTGKAEASLDDVNIGFFNKRNCTSFKLFYSVCGRQRSRLKVSKKWIYCVILKKCFEKQACCSSHLMHLFPFYVKSESRISFENNVQARRFRNFKPKHDQSRAKLDLKPKCDQNLDLDLEPSEVGEESHLYFHNRHTDTMFAHISFKNIWTLDLQSQD